MVDLGDGDADGAEGYLGGHVARRGRFVVTGCRVPGEALPQQGEADTDSDYLVVERVRFRNEMDDEVIAAGQCGEPDQPAEGRYPCGEAAEVVADAWQAAQKCDSEQQPNSSPPTMLPKPSSRAMIVNGSSLAGRVQIR